MAKKKKESFEEYKKRTQNETVKLEPKKNSDKKESFEDFMKKRQKNMSTEYGAYMDRASILKNIGEGRTNERSEDKAYGNESWNNYYNKQLNQVTEQGKAIKKSLGRSKKTKEYRDSIDQANSKLADTSRMLANRNIQEAKEQEKKEDAEIANNVFDIAMKKVLGFDRNSLSQEQEKKETQARKDAMNRLKSTSQAQTFVNDRYTGQGVRKLIGNFNAESDRRQKMRNNLYSATENDEKKWSVEDTDKKIKELETQKQKKAEERWKIEKGKELGMKGRDEESSDLKYEIDFLDEKVKQLSDLKQLKQVEKANSVYNQLSEEGKKIISGAASKDARGAETLYVDKVITGISDEDQKILSNSGMTADELKEWKSREYSEGYNTVMQQATKQATEKNGLTAAGMSLASVGLNVLSPIQDLPEVAETHIKNKIKGTDIPIDTNKMYLSNTRDTIRDTAAEMTGSDLGKFLYQTGMSMADFLTAAPTGGAATFIMGSTSGISAMKEAKERGVSDDQAVLTGITAGVAEGFFEKFSLENLKVLQASGKSGIKNMVKDVAKQSFTEGSEEFFTDISNSITDNLINGGLSEYEYSVKGYMKSGMSEEEARRQASADFAKQLGLSFAGGALSGGVMGTGKIGLNSIAERQSNKNVGKSLRENDEVQSVIDTAAAFDETLDSTKINTDDDKAIGKLAKKTVKKIESQLESTSTLEELDETYRGIVEKTSSPTIQSELIPMYETAKRRIGESRTVNVSASEPLPEGGRVDLRQMAQEVADRQINQQMRSESVPNSSENRMSVQSAVNEPKLKYGENTVPQNASRQFTEPQKTNSNINLSRNTDTAAVYLDTGTPAVVERFANVDRENTTVELSDGSQVALNDLAMQDGKTQQVMNAAAALDNTAAANVFVEDYQENVPITTYTEACYRLYNAGKAGVNNADTIIRQIAGGTNVPKATLLKMHAIGSNQMQAEKSSEKKTNIARRAEGKVSDNRVDIGDSDILRKVAEKIAQKTGQDISIEEVLEQDANGTYKAGQGMISVSENANNAITTLIHETQEFAYENNREGMDKFIDTFLEYMAEEKGYATVERMLQAYHSTYARVEGDTTVRQAAKEMVFDAAGGLFADEKGMNEFISWLNENETTNIEQKKGILQSLADFFRDMIDKMKAYMKEHHLNMAASQAMSMEIEAKEKLRTMLMEEIDKAGENYKEEQGKQESVATSQNKNDIKEEVNYSINPDFTKEYDEWDKVDARKTFTLGRTSQSLKEVGVQDRVIKMDASKLIRIKAEHREMTDDVIKQIPEILENPIIILESFSVSGRIVMFGDILINGKPVLAALELNPQNREGYYANEIKVVSSYKKDSVQQLIDKSKILWINQNKNKTDNWLRRTRVQFPVDLNQTGLINKIIPQKVSFVNDSISKKIEKSDNNAEKLRHSLEVTVPTKDIVAENEHLQEMVKYLKEEFVITGGTQPSRSQIEGVSRKIIRDTSSKYDSKVLADNLSRLYEYLHSENANQKEGLKIASEIARGVLEESVLKDTEMYDIYKPMREYFRKTKIKLSEGQKKEVAYLYGSYGAFRKQNMGRLNLSDEGVSLDMVYGELANMYPEFFDYGTNEGDQPFAVVDALDAIKPQIRSINQEDMDTYAYEVAGTIFREISGVQARETFADRKEREKREALTKLSQKYDKRVKEIKKQAKEAYQTNVKQFAADYNKANLETQRRLQEEIRELEDNLKGAGHAVVNDLRIELVKKNEQIRALRKNHSIQIANMKAKMGHSQKMRRQNMQRTEFKNSIRKNCRRINRLLVKPTDKNHVPEPLQEPLTKFIAGIDLIDDNESTSSMKFQDLINCMNEIKDKLENYEGKNGEEPAVEWEKYYMEVDPDYVTMLQKSIEDVTAAVRISDMTLEQLANLDLVVKGAAKMVSSVNKLFENGKYQTIDGLGQATISDLKEHRSKKGEIPVIRHVDKMLNTDMLTPREFFEQLGEGATSVYHEIRQGFNTRVWDIKKAQEFMLAETKDIDMKAITRKVHTFTIGDKTFKMTAGQLMELYCLSKREQAREHILKGGIAVNEFREKGKIRTNEKTVPIKMHEVSLQRILKELSPEERALADHMQEFLSTECSEWGNEVSMKMYGYRKFTEKNYYPIKVDSNQTKTNDENQTGEDKSGFYRIKNQGMTKATTKGAYNTIVVSDIFDTFTQHVTNMASYHAYCVPLSDAMRWYNYRFVEREQDGFMKSNSIKGEMERVYGKKSKKYFEQLLLDINGENSAESKAVFSDKMLSNWKVAAVAGNMGVVMQQPTAYIRVANVMNPKYMSKAVLMKPAIKESQEKNAIAQWKAWGYYDTMIGKSMKEVITGDTTVSDKIRDKTTVLAGKADDVTWGVIYNAVKLEIRETKPELKEGTAAFDEAVNKRFDDIIDKTQVVDTVLTKPGYMRSEKAFHRLTGAFMAEPMLTYNMLRRSLVDFYDKKPGAVEKLGRATAVFGIQCVVNAAVRSINDAVRSDDDDEYWKKWLNAFGGNVLDNVNPLGMVPYAKDILSMFQGYELKRSDMEGISLLVKSTLEIAKDPGIILDIFTGEAFTDKKKYGKFKRIVNGLSKTTGLPLYNLYRDMVEPVMKLVNGGPLVSDSKSTDIYEDYYDEIAGEGEYEKKKESEEKQSSNDTSLHIAQLMEAIREKDSEKETELRKTLSEEGNTREDIAKKLRTALGKADPRIEEAANCRISGDTSGYKKIANEVINEGFDHSLVMEAINNKINAIKSESTSQDDKGTITGETSVGNQEEVAGWYTNADIVAALDSGNDTEEIIKDIVDTKKANGKTDKQIEQSIKSGLSSAYRKIYQEGNSAVRQEIISKLTKVRVNGKYIFTQGTNSIFTRWNRATE